MFNIYSSVQFNFAEASTKTCWIIFLANNESTLEVTAFLKKNNTAGEPDIAILSGSLEN